MFSHVMLRANDIEQSKQFYDAILGSLGHAPGVLDPKGRYFYLTSNGVFAITKPIHGLPDAEGQLSVTVSMQQKFPAGCNWDRTFSMVAWSKTARFRLSHSEEISSDKKMPVC